MMIKILGQSSYQQKNKKDGSPRKSMATGRYHLNMNESRRSESNFHLINLQKEQPLAQKKIQEEGVIHHFGEVRTQTRRTSEKGHKQNIILKMLR